MTIDPTTSAAATAAAATTPTDNRRRIALGTRRVPAAARHAAAASGSDAAAGRRRVPRAARAVQLARAAAADQHDAHQDRRRLRSAPADRARPPPRPRRPRARRRSRLKDKRNGSFSASLSGLNANQQKLSVIGNNLANINTIALQGEHGQLLGPGQPVGRRHRASNPMQIGLGVTTGSISPNFTQGGIENTGVPTNVAIQGSGFFVVGDANDRVLHARRRLLVRRQRHARHVGRPAGAGLHGDRSARPARSSRPASRRNIIVPPGVLRAPVATTQFGDVEQPRCRTPPSAPRSPRPSQIYDSLGAAHVATDDLHEDRRRARGATRSPCPARMSPAAPSAPADRDRHAAR